MRFKKCPFCGRGHFVKSYMNVICSCGAKYYFSTDDWLDRTRTNSRKEDSETFLPKNKSLISEVYDRRLAHLKEVMGK